MLIVLWALSAEISSLAFTVLSAVAAVPSDDARPRMIFLWGVDARTPQWLRPALVFDEVPMFYHLLLIPLIHLLAVIVCYARYGQVHWMFESPTVEQFPITPPPGWGFSLPIVCLVWAFVVFVLYPLAVGLHPRSSAAAMPGSVISELG